MNHNLNSEIVLRVRTHVVLAADYETFRQYCQLTKRRPHQAHFHHTIRTAIYCGPECDFRTKGLDVTKHSDMVMVVVGDVLKLRPSTRPLMLDYLARGGAVYPPYDGPGNEFRRAMFNATLQGVLAE